MQVLPKELLETHDIPIPIPLEFKEAQGGKQIACHLREGTELKILKKSEAEEEDRWSKFFDEAGQFVYPEKFVDRRYDFRNLI